MDGQETIEDIIAEMRGIRVREFQDYADRFDAAHRREVATTKESLAVGNSGDCAKLREALKAIGGLCDRLIPTWDGAIGRIKDIAEDALSAPPRNCDIYLTEEAVDAATMTVRDCVACPSIDMEAPCVFCMVRWLLAPATEKEGGTNG